MHIPEAKQYLGRHVAVSYRDRHGEMLTQTMKLEDISYVPMYGACLVGDVQDIWLDRVTGISAVE